MKKKEKLKGKLVLKDEVIDLATLDESELEAITGGLVKGNEGYDCRSACIYQSSADDVHAANLYGGTHSPFWDR